MTVDADLIRFVQHIEHQMREEWVLSQLLHGIWPFDDEWIAMDLIEIGYATDEGVDILRVEHPHE